MSAATFAELAQVASERLRAAVAGLPAGGLEPGAVAGALGRAGLVVHRLTRYLDDLVGADELEAVLGEGGGGARRAAAHAREALAMAGACLGWAADAVGAAGPGGGLVAAGPGATDAALSGAAAALMAGRDLLGTHVPAGDSGERLAASYWAAVITSAEVSEALADQVGQWSGQLATWARGLLAATTADPRFPGTARQDLASAYRWLQAASMATGAVRDPGQLAAGRMLLRAIPGNAVPQSRPLAGPEPDPVLCEGITVSAARLRAVAWASPGEGGWAPELTAESWQWTATATAVISDISELLLTALAEQADQAGLLSADGRSPGTARQLLADAAQAAAITCDRWREVVTAWGKLTTDTKGRAAPGIADTSDLVIRLGRLTFADPVWAPVRSKRAVPRDPAGLAPDKEQASAILAAVHDAADALAAKSVADLRDVEAAVGARRLYAPTSTLPERYDIPRPYGPAMPASTDNLVEAYQVAVTASQNLAVALDAVAVTVSAPSQVLALARTAITPAAEGRTDQRVDDQHEDASAIPVPGEIGSKAERPGPVERQVRATGTADPALLLRARAIDKAVTKVTQRLIAQASDALRQADAPDDAGVAQTGHTTSNPRAIAAQSFPRNPRRPAIDGRAPDGSARQTRTDRSDVRHRPARR